MKNVEFSIGDRVKVYDIFTGMMVNGRIFKIETMSYGAPDTSGMAIRFKKYYIVKASDGTHIEARAPLVYPI